MDKLELERVRRDAFRARFRQFDDDTLISVPEAAIVADTTAGGLYKRYQRPDPLTGECDAPPTVPRRRPRERIRIRVGDLRAWIKGLTSTPAAAPLIRTEQPNLDPIQNTLSLPAHKTRGRPRRPPLIGLVGRSVSTSESGR